jgi:DNA-binding response OmpR family regulator
MQKALAKEYTYIPVQDPTKALEVLATEKPDLILLDVNMPEIDGYELCRKLRLIDSMKDIPVVFLTCRTTLEDRLLGFESGGTAYVTKPFDITELKHIIKTQIDFYQKYKLSQALADDAKNLTWTLMQNNGEVGQVIQYARDLSNTGSSTELIDHTCSALQSFGLDSAVSLRLISGDVYMRNQSTPASPIEQELLELSHSAKRINYSGKVYIFSGKRCSFLIKNMPVENEDYTGRLKDHLAIMLEFCDSCVELINYRIAEKSRQQRSASDVQSAILSEFDNIIEQFESLNKKAKSTIESLAQNIEGSFMFLGLYEEQEQQLTEYIEQAQADIARYLDEGLTLQESMNRLALHVSKLSNET